MSPDTLFAEVAIPVPVRQTFTYRVPAAFRADLAPGRQVTVPFGRRTAEGFVVALTKRATREDLKEILAVDGTGPQFTPELLDLTKWLADYYLCSWGEALKAALPGGLEPTSVRPRGSRVRRAAAAAAPPPPRPAAPSPPLNEDQRQIFGPVVEALDSGGHQTFLLFGVTGSGKTEIYLQAAAHAARAGGQTLVLVPEISLSPQMLERFESRFPGRVVVWHSALPAGRRKEAWRRVHDGSADIVVGARSAVFAPLPRLRLVVVDEEHEPAFKQDESPRYHGRDVAIYRAHKAGATVVLGSATPSLESFHHAMNGKYRLLELPRRVDDRPTPRVTLVPLERRGAGRAADLDDGGRRGGPPADDDAPPPSSILTTPLLIALRDRLKRAEQAILFLNRRGHSTVVRCGDCDHVARCPHCDISLTWHADRAELRCHYCAHRARRYDVCPECGGVCFLFRGIGTQKVEAELARLLPQARCRRMDFDSTRRRGVLEKIVDDVRQRRIDVLLGTQMVARGLDFPGITLVGVINADTQLNLPDFRSAERTFQLLTQVAGRAGRGSQPGEVIVQTFAAGHYAVEAAARQDYRSFYETEMEFRREVDYPPLTRMVNLLFDGKDEQQVIRRAEEVAALLRRKLEADRARVELLGPAPQSLSRLKGKYRWHVTLKGRDHRRLRSLADEILATPAEKSGGVRLCVDVDPMSLL